MTHSPYIPEGHYYDPDGVNTRPEMYFFDEYGEEFISCLMIPAEIEWLLRNWDDHKSLEPQELIVLINFFGGNFKEIYEKAQAEVVKGSKYNIEKLIEYDFDHLSVVNSIFPVENGIDRPDELVQLDLMIDYYLLFFLLENGRPIKARQEELDAFGSNKEFRKMVAYSYLFLTNMVLAHHRNIGETDPEEFGITDSGFEHLKENKTWAWEFIEEH